MKVAKEVEEEAQAEAPAEGAEEAKDGDTAGEKETVPRR